MINIQDLNERVWNTGSTEVHTFNYLNCTYHLIQIEDDDKAGLTYVFRERELYDIDKDRFNKNYEAIIHINWQAGGVNAYIKNEEARLVLHYLLSALNKDQYGIMMDGYLYIDNNFSEFENAKYFGICTN